MAVSIRDTNGVIVNAIELTVDDVVQERVLCPACRQKVFAMWPGGWDAHSAAPCAGLSGITAR